MTSKITEQNKNIKQLLLNIIENLKSEYVDSMIFWERTAASSLDIRIGIGKDDFQIRHIPAFFGNKGFYVSYYGYEWRFCYNEYGKEYLENIINNLRDIYYDISNKERIQNNTKIIDNLENLLKDMR